MTASAQTQLETTLEIPSGWQKEGPVVFPDGRMWTACESSTIKEFVRDSYLRERDQAPAGSLGLIVVYPRESAQAVERASAAAEKNEGIKIGRNYDNVFRYGYVVIPQTADPTTVLRHFVEAEVLSARDYQRQTGADYNERPKVSKSLAQTSAIQGPR